MATVEEVAGEDTQHLNAIFGNIKGYRARIADLEQLLKKSQQENEWLRDELRAHQRGERLQIIIEGRTFTPVLDGPVPTPEQPLNITDVWLNEPPKVKTRVLEDSFILSKD